MGKGLRIGIITAAVLLTLVLFGPFLIPIPQLENTLPPEQLADPESQFLEINGLKLHYKKTGSGEPAIILLHGFGASLFTWREVMDPLSNYGTVIAYDRPAFGLTERPLSWEADLNPYAPEAQVEQLIGLLDSLGIEKAILVGNSAGGTVSVQTALKYPDRILALVLVDAAVYSGGGSPAWLRLLVRTPQLDHLGPLLVRRIAATGNTSIENAWHDPTRITSDIFEGYRLPLQVNNWDRALWEFNKAGKTRNLEQALTNISLPVLVLSGDDDRLIPLELSQRLAGDIPGAELIIFTDCGHLPQEECPSQFLEALDGFLGQLGY